MLLSCLWIFATANYLYCDILGLMDPVLLNQWVSGVVHGMHIDSTFLLFRALLMEIPIAMIIAARLLKYWPNRIANIAAGTVMTLVQAATLVVGAGPTSYYLFFSIMEIAGTLAIVGLALTWKNPAKLLMPSMSEIKNGGT